MTTILIFIFCFFVAIVIYVYLGYPLLLHILSTFPKRSVCKDDKLLKVSMIIAAYNEEKVIREKIENTLNLDYPKDQLQVIVASDCSCDRTNEIVTEYKNEGVLLYVQNRRMGKSSALNNAVTIATGDILIFSDATAILEQNCIKYIVRNFNDPAIGCVCPYVTYVNMTDNHITKIEGCYRSYESKIKQLESNNGSLAFVPGACFAIRRELHRPVEPEYDYDCITPLDVILQKYRVVYEVEARFYETIVTSLHDLFTSKVRMITKDFSGTLSRKQLLNPFKYCWVSVALLSHKLIRWLVPFFLIIILSCNLFLVHIDLFLYLLIGQALFYLVALVGFLSNHKKGFFSIPLYFCVVNLAALVGVYQAMIGRKIPTWQPVR